MKYLFLLTFLSLLLGSCSPRLTPFTSELKDEQGWREADLKKIQYYLSDDIILWRDISDEDAKIVEGKIKLKNGRKIEEIIFAKGTPGVFLFSPKRDQFAIGFENSDDKYLMFGTTKKMDEFVLLAANWKKNYGKISYGDKIYYTDESSAYARLLVDLKALRTIDVNRRKAKGRTID